MKTDIHPEYFHKATVACACGANFEVGSTMKEYRVDVCSHCHPFYTGKQNLVDTAGMVDKFKARQEIANRRKAELENTAKNKDKKETVEEKMTRKAQENKAEKEAEKEAKEEEKKVIAKKRAAQTVVKKAD